MLLQLDGQVGEMLEWQRGSIEAVFEAAGIETLPVDIGVQIFVDEALRGGKRRVIACGSLGMMDRFDAFREAPLMLQRIWLLLWLIHPDSRSLTKYWNSMNLKWL